MTIKRKRKEWEMTGQVIGIRPKKIAQGPMKGVMNYFLDVKLVFSPVETFPGYFHVMKEKLRNDEIWEKVVASNFWEGKYTFIASKHGET